MCLRLELIANVMNKKSCLRHPRTLGQQISSFKIQGITHKRETQPWWKVEAILQKYVSYFQWFIYDNISIYPTWGSFDNTVVLPKYTKHTKYTKTY